MRSWIKPAAALSLAAAVLLGGCRASKQEESETVREQIEAQCMAIAQVCREAYLAGEKTPAEYPEGTYSLTQNGIDGVEECLIGAGYPTLDTQAGYPQHLANPEAVDSFWAQVQAGEAARLQFFQVLESGGFSCVTLCYDGTAGQCYLMDVAFDAEGQPTVSFWEERQVYDWELTENRRFYYQIRPCDGHGVDYSVLRLEPVDRELWDLTQAYIAPVGYLKTNLFLCDWDETDFGQLSFNDVFEYLYAGDAGSADFPRHTDPYYAMVPAAVFEEAVLPYFAISQQELRERAMYDEETDSYPWKPLESFDYVGFRFLEQEVTAWEANPDGTITLTVNVSYPEEKLDTLFRHEVTIRPLEDGGFQYVSNRVTEQTARGMPSAQPRLEE